MVDKSLLIAHFLNVDGRGARILSLRIAVGAAPGERVAVISVDGDGDGVKPGDRGTLLSIDEASLRVEFDSGEELVVDPSVVRLGRARDVA